VITKKENVKCMILSQNVKFYFDKNSNELLYQKHPFPRSEHEKVILKATSKRNFYEEISYG
jgi:hypothetical protein